MSLHLRRPDIVPPPCWRWDASYGQLPPNATFTSSSAARTYLGSDGFLKTAAANAARFAFGGGGISVAGAPQSFDGILLENACTNACLQNRDLTQAVWTKTNATVAKDQVGIDGVANSASHMTATANSGQVSQAITLTSAQSHSVFLKRLSGTGAIKVSVDNGTTFTTIPGGSLPSATWQRYVLSQTITNPTLVIQLATNGDSIAVDYAQVQTDAFASSPIATGSGVIATSADILTVPITSYLNPGGASILVRWTPYYASTMAAARNLFSASDGTTSNRIAALMAAAATTPSGRVSSGGSAALSGATAGPAVVAGSESTVIVSTSGGAGTTTGAGPSAYVVNDQGAVKVTTGPGVPVGVTNLGIGTTDAFAAGGLFGCIREVSIWPFPINAELAARLTAHR